MISDGSRDTEEWGKTADENSALHHKNKWYIKKIKRLL